MKDYVMTVMLNVRRIKEDEFEVQSHSNPNTWYKVNIKSHTCTCPHYIMRMRHINSACKHYTDLMEYLNNLGKVNQDKYIEIEKIIKEKDNFIEWDKISDIYGEDIVNDMIKLGRLIQLKRGYLSVL